MAPGIRRKHARGLNGRRCCKWPLNHVELLLAEVTEFYGHVHFVLHQQHAAETNGVARVAQSRSPPVGGGRGIRWFLTRYSGNMG